MAIVDGSKITIDQVIAYLRFKHSRIEDDYSHQHRTLGHLVMAHGCAAIPVSQQVSKISDMAKTQEAINEDIAKLVKLRQQCCEHIASTNG